jgi:large subunit ribosomal protein L15
MKLNELVVAPGAKKDRKRVGRGFGSGTGKQSGKGHKGSHARSGKNKPRLGSEGGQTPLVRRLPKRGFSNINRKTFAVINLRDLNCFEAKTEVTLKLMVERNLVKQIGDGVKVLGVGPLNVKGLTVSAHAFSASAKAEIEKQGGSVQVLN